MHLIESAEARKVSKASIVLVSMLVVSAPIAVGVGLPDDDALPGTGEEKRLVVGFYELPDDLESADSYNGARIVNRNEAIDFVAVMTDDPVGFRARAMLDGNVKYVEDAPTLQLIDYTPDVPKAPPQHVPEGSGEGILDFTPNDPSYGSQYGPNQIRVNQVWDVTLGNTNAAVCVADTGVRHTHQDLTGTRWLGGYDFINNDADPMDDNGHGTHVAGTAAATINNGLNVAGMGNVGLYGAKVLNSAGSGTWDQVANGITWCADNTMARTVISLSLGGSGGATVLANAVSYAFNTKGKLVVAAAGNDGPCSNCVGYPAKYPESIAVTCTTSTESLCSFSSTGPEAYVAAPGNGIISTWHTSNTATNTISGTSMSTPHVSGVLALVWSAQTTLTNAQLKTRLANTAQDLGAAGRDNNFGYGEVDAKCLYDNTSPCGTAPPPPGCSGGPANNCFASATAGSGDPYSTSQSTSGATTESGEPAPCGSIGATVWFTYTPSVSGTMTIDTMGSNFDTVVAAYTGSSLTGLTNVACNDDISGTDLDSRISFSATAGTTYRIQAGGYSGATGSLTFKVDAPNAVSCTGPANNCFSTAINVASRPYTNTQSTSGATLESGEPRPCGSIGATVWYKWTAPASGSVTIDTMGSNFDTVLAVYTGSAVNALTNVACNDDISGSDLDSRVTFSATSGVTYRIQVGGYNGATGSTMKINM